MYVCVLYHTVCVLLIFSSVCVCDCIEMVCLQCWEGGWKGGREGGSPTGGREAVMVEAVTVLIKQSVSADSTL